MAKSVIGAGVAVSVPAAGGLLAAAPASAAMPAAKGAEGTTPARTSAAQPLVAFGSTGAAVKVVQARVGVTADGVFGPATLSAVKRFQSSNGLTADGVVGPLTWAKVGGSVTTAPATPGTSPVRSGGSLSCSAASTTVRYGSSGQLVKILQSRVGVSADGFFGSATQGAVMNFQGAHGLAADGVVGPLTWSKLGCASAAPTGTDSATAPSPVAPKSGVTTGTASGASVIAMAKRFVGVPYVWGGSTPSGFDCSGFTSYVYKQLGYSMPRTAAQQQAYFRSVSTPQPGDLIFYGSPAYHVGIYVGDGLMIDSAHPGSLIAVRSIYGTPSGYARVL